MHILLYIHSYVLCPYLYDLCTDLSCIRDIQILYMNAYTYMENRLENPPPLLGHPQNVSRLRESQPAALAIIALLCLVAFFLEHPQTFLFFLNGLPVEYILTSFGDEVTALSLGTPNSWKNDDKDSNEKHNASMMPAWSWPGSDSGFSRCFYRTSWFPPYFCWRPKRRLCVSRSLDFQNQLFLYRLTFLFFYQLAKTIFCYPLNIMLRVSFSPDRDRVCRHCWISPFWTPLGKRPL